MHVGATASEENVMARWKWDNAQATRWQRGLSVGRAKGEQAGVIGQLGHRTREDDSVSNGAGVRLRLAGSATT
jgi:hypothetical protein